MPRLAMWLRSKNGTMKRSSAPQYSIKLRRLTPAWHDLHSLMQDPPSRVSHSSIFEGKWETREDEKAREGTREEGTEVRVEKL